MRNMTGKCNNAVRTMMFITVTVLVIGQVSVSTLAFVYLLAEMILNSQISYEIRNCASLVYL